MVKIRVLIAESSDISLSGIYTILNGSRQIEIQDTARSASEALTLFAKHTPDVTLVSSSLKEFQVHDFMQRIFSMDQGANVVILSDHITINDLNQALKARVTGYLTKNIEKHRFRKAILEASKGERVFSETASSLITQRYTKITQGGQKPVEQITPREAEILQLIVDGHTSQEIAGILFISPRTVETHRSNLLQKLNLKNTAGLVRFALQEGNAPGS